MEQKFITPPLTPGEVADFVKVDEEQVYQWIRDDKVPYLELGDRGDYRIPFQGFLASMHNLFDLADDVKATLPSDLNQS